MNSKDKNPSREMKIAAVGPRDQLCALLAVGVETFDAETAAKADELVRELSGNGNYGVILIPESLAEGMEACLSPDRERALPALLPIPGAAESSGFALRRITQMVRKAIGINLEAMA